VEERLDGGNAGGAVRVGDTVRKPAGPWTPAVHARHVVEREGFTDFGARPGRLRLFLAEYGWTGTAEAFLAVVRARITALVAGVRELAVTGEPLFGQIIAQGQDADLCTALAQLDEVS
jgi:hypothetical protein